MIFRPVVWFFASLEVAMQRLFARVVPPRYVVVGECVKCGKCCKEIVFNPPKFVKNTWLLRFFIVFHKITHNFSVVGRGAEGEIYFSCGHLKADGRCGSHKTRPYICRNFPVVPFFEPPKILPYCSYQVAAAPVARMRERPSLRIINSRMAVHHPSPDPNVPESQHYHTVDVVSPKPVY